jgi:PAS domain S-box-containing protein
MSQPDMLLTGKSLRNTVVAVVVAAAIAGIVVLVLLALEVTRKLDLLDTASSDNVQWTLSQAEVEFLEFQAAIRTAQDTGATELLRVRREFDIFYSRVTTLERSPLYGPLRDDPDYGGALQDIRSFLDRSVPLIDASDDRLISALPELAAEAADLRATVRTLSVNGLDYFAQQADARREGVAVTLLRLEAAAIVLLSVLVIAALVLAGLYRLANARAADLQRTSRRLGTVVDTSLDAIIVANRRGEILEFNPAAERIFGHARADVLGREMGDLIVPAKFRAAHDAGMDRYRRTGEKKVIGKGRVKLEAMRANGEVFPVELAIQSAEGVGGEIFISFLRDISHRVAAENELVKARDQAVAGEKAKAEFLAVMSHEIRTPLNGLLGTLALMKDTKLSARQKDHIETMENSGALLLHHVNDVLDISKYEAGKLAPALQAVDLNALLQSVIDNQRDIAAKADNALDWGWVGTPMPMVMTDPLRLRQVLINLVGNAVKFTSAGRITLEVEAGPPGNDGACPVSFRVIDTGIGIAPDQIDRMFRDFETGDSSYGRRTGGTGLGLGIARRLTEALGGEIGAESELGAGSVFWIEIPLGPAGGPPRSAPPDAGAGSDAPRHKVLIVEDNEINRTVLRQMLLADGHQVTEAHDGADGVRRAGAERFDLILMDISMPVMDGREATAAIRAGDGPNRDVPIIAVTAHALPAEIEEFRRYGIDRYLSKPIDRAELRALLAAPVVMHGARAAVDESEPALPLLDVAHLDGLCTDLSAETVTDLVERFVIEAEDILPDLAAGDAHRQDLSEVRALAHKLAGSAAAFGALRLRQALTEVQTNADAGEPAQVLAACEALPAIWQDTKDALHDAMRATGRASETGPN